MSDHERKAKRSAFERSSRRWNIAVYIVTGGLTIAWAILSIAVIAGL